MAVLTTSAPFQQVPMPAVDLRQLVGGLVAAEGVRTSADLTVAQRGAGANMSVDIAPGSCSIQDDHGSGGGFYSYTLAATANIVITAADPTNPRVDRVVVRVRDQALGDATNAVDIFVVAGTPTGGATLANCTGAGAVPGSCLLLGNVLVPAASSSVVTANIDTTGASNNSPAVRPSLGLTGSLARLADVTLSVAAATIDFINIPAGYAHLMAVLYGRGDTAATAVALAVRMNNDSGANYNLQQLTAVNATLSGAGSAASASVNLGAIPAATAPANEFGACSLKIPHYAGASNFKACTSDCWWETADTAAGQSLTLSGGVWKSAAAINRITFVLGAGNFVAGSRVTLYGLP